MRRVMAVLFLAFATFLAACSGSAGGDSVINDVEPDDGKPDEGTPPDSVQPDAACQAPQTECGATCCDENWICSSGKCIQCGNDTMCKKFDGCTDGRCFCNADKECELKDCDQACPDWEHCEWAESGMTCVGNVCDDPCDFNERCVKDVDGVKACAYYCDESCDDGTHCEWKAGAMECVGDPCDPACPTSQKCVNGACVDNECTGEYTNEQCEALTCVCLADGSCGDCTDCVPACPEGFFCSLEGGALTCVEIVCEPPCTNGQRCLPGNECVDNVCTPACAPGGWCSVDGGTDADCVYECVPECAFDQYCDQGVCYDKPCDQICDPGSHCEFGTDSMLCVETVCEQACGLGEVCTWNATDGAAVCVDVVCNPECADYQYCDEKGVCQPFVCDPTCAKGKRCIDGLCVNNECDPTCPDGKYCNQNLVCIDPCEGCGTEGPTVCALVDSAGAAFQVFDNLCKAQCFPGFQAVAVCGEYALDPVCDVTGYLANPLADNTYDNICDAQCHGKTELVHGSCSCAVTCTDDELLSGPMCGQDCNDYTNLCDVRCAETSAQYPGTCQAGCGVCPPCDAEPCFDPVCGVDGNTYQSACDLTVCNGVELAYPGICVPAECPCSATPMPVCATMPGDPDHWETLPNVCVANCLDATVLFDYVCPATCCDPRPFEPVCAHNTFLETWTREQNQCVVDAYGFFAETYPGECVCCNAPGSVDGCCDLSQKTPVCGVDGVTYANTCALTCAGVAKDYDGECHCPATWDPVCGDSTLTPGKTYTYANGCIAKSVYGVTSFTTGACNLCTLACADAVGAPVCGLDGASYPDVCYLVKCNGDATTLNLNDSACNGTCPCL